MYTTCLFCQGDLGRNETIEALPVGRRLAFDGERGRLWVVCRRCERWNLTPFEERWEAIEQCERAFRGTRLRVSTGNIGLARLPEGLELVRVGEALRPELAAWRYGDQFGRRRRRSIALTTGVILAAGAVYVAGPAAGLYTIGSLQGLNMLTQLGVHYRERRHVVARVPVASPEGTRVLTLAPIHARRTRLVPDGGGWALELAHQAGERLRWDSWNGLRHDTPSVTLTGEEAVRAAGRVLPHLNSGGGSRAQVADAVRLVEDGGGVAGCFASAAKVPTNRPARSLVEGMGLTTRSSVPPGTLAALPKEVRLALEMAAHEESERRALEGELAELERVWKEAEEIAAIADDLLLPEGTAARLDALRKPRVATGT